MNAVQKIMKAVDEAGAPEVMPKNQWKEFLEELHAEIGARLACIAEEEENDG